MPPGDQKIPGNGPTTPAHPALPVQPVPSEPPVPETPGADGDQFTPASPPPLAVPALGPPVEASPAARLQVIAAEGVEYADGGAELLRLAIRPWVETALLRMRHRHMYGDGVGHTPVSPGHISREVERLVGILQRIIGAGNLSEMIGRATSLAALDAEMATILEPASLEEWEELTAFRESILAQRILRMQREPQSIPIHPLAWELLSEEFHGGRLPVESTVWTLLARKNLSASLPPPFHTDSIPPSVVHAAFDHFQPRTIRDALKAIEATAEIFSEGRRILAEEEDFDLRVRHARTILWEAVIIALRREPFDSAQARRDAMIATLESLLDGRLFWPNALREELKNEPKFSPLPEFLFSADEPPPWSTERITNLKKLIITAAVLQSTAQFPGEAKKIAIEMATDVRILMELLEKELMMSSVALQAIEDLLFIRRRYDTEQIASLARELLGKLLAIEFEERPERGQIPPFATTIQTHIRERERVDEILAEFLRRRGKALANGNGGSSSGNGSPAGAAPAKNGSTPPAPASPSGTALARASAMRSAAELVRIPSGNHLPSPPRGSQLMNMMMMQPHSGRRPATGWNGAGVWLGAPFGQNLSAGAHALPGARIMLPTLFGAGAPPALPLLPR